MAEIARWEYRIESFGTFWSKPKDEELQATLDEWGEEGWEVVGVWMGGNNEKVTLLAKRPLGTATRRRRTWPGD